jgi:acyl-CoA reductase-like NAD-dependent aldehyde dehydrogenase
MTTTRLLIDGVECESASQTSVEVINPSNGRCVSSIPAGCDDDVERAVAAARRAFNDGRWGDEPPSVRKKALHRLADLVEAEGAQFDAMDAEEMGKPVKEVAFNATAAASFVRFYAEAVDKLTGDVYTSDKASLVLQRWVARGVVAGIVPWNFPTFVAAMKLGPALAAGNTVILKPSELSPGSAVRLGQLALRAGIPPGVLNVVPGLGETAGKALALHSDVDMIAFTGSTEVGKLLLQYAGQSNLKSVMAECGGKSPQVVFGDGVDLDAAATAIAGFLLTNQGQICSVGSRLLVQQAVEDDLLERIMSHFRKIVIGDARDPRTTFGPLASAKQCDRVMRYIESASTDRAELVAGGKRTLQASGGYFVEPTIFRKVTPTARIAQEEIFGPVLSVMSFEDEAEAIRIANSTTYGLGAYVWTSNLSTGMRMAKGIRSSVAINSVAPTGEGAGYAASWEPCGQSGIGAEGGLAGMQSYLRRQLMEFYHA